MTKFSTADNEDFKRLSRTLNLMLQKSKPKVEANWTAEARVKQGKDPGAGYRLNILLLFCGAQIESQLCYLFWYKIQSMII